MTTKQNIEKILNEIIPNFNPNQSVGRYYLSDDIFYNIDEYFPKRIEEGKYESHRKYVDVQYLLEGEEYIYVRNREGMDISQKYSDENDVEFYYPTEADECHLMKSGSVLVLYPQDAHMPSIETENKCHVKKVVFKVRIDE
ncbi:MAG: YhcH/YjgK/YiaL family protein [Acutalibacteraceae bacterium]